MEVNYLASSGTFTALEMHIFSLLRAITSDTLHFLNLKEYFGALKLTVGDKKNPPCTF